VLGSAPRVEVRSTELPLLALRRRKWSLPVVAVTVLVIGVPFHLLFPQFSLDS